MSTQPQNPATYGLLTTTHGIPVGDGERAQTAGPGGPVLLQDGYLLEKMAQFNRERVPERVVHAKGAGAHGSFEVTHDVTDLCKADFLSEVGKRTDMTVRFSTVAGESGSADTNRDPRGFALKFRTAEGNWDMVGNNTPVFFVRDPSLFQDFIRSQKRMGASHSRDHGMQWDFWSLRPESLHQVLILMSDRGTPDGFRFMNGYGSHTFRWVNAAGEGVWVKFHFKTDQGIKNLTDEEAGKLAGLDPDYATRDLHNAISAGDFPSWTMYVQTMTDEQAETYRFNPFDLTKVWLQGDFSLRRVGRFTLDRNPGNYFAEIEQSSFEPNNLVPGIEPSPDPMLQARLFSYADAHRYRIGTNYALLPVNQAANTVNSYAKDGSMRFGTNNGDAPVYWPASEHGPAGVGPQPDPAYQPVDGLTVSGTATLHSWGWHEGDDDVYLQPGLFYRMLDETNREHLVDNLVGHLLTVSVPLRERQMEHFRRADQDLADRVAKGLANSGFADRAATPVEAVQAGFSIR